MDFMYYETQQSCRKVSTGRFSALSKSLQFKWTYLQMIVPDCSAAFAPEWDALNAFFLASSF